MLENNKIDKHTGKFGSAGLMFFFFQFRPFEVNKKKIADWDFKKFVCTMAVTKETQQNQPDLKFLTKEGTFLSLNFNF